MEQELIELSEEMENQALNQDYISADSLLYYKERIEQIINKYL